MPKVKATEVDIDPDELEDADEGEQRDFEDYDGPLPPAGTILILRAKTAWWTATSDDSARMIKIIYIAEGNTGQKKQFNGCPAWENLALSPSSAWKYKPWLRANGLTAKDIKTKLYLAPPDQDTDNGALIEKIAGWEPGEDSALVRGVMKRDRYQGVQTAKIQRYLPLDEEDEDEEPEEEEAPRTRRGAKSSRTPAKSRRARDEEPDEDEESDEEEEDEQPRSRRSSRTSKTRSRARDDDEDDEEAEDEEEERPRSRARSSSRAKSRSQSRTSSGRGRGKSRDDEDDDPPF
jgi:hypothetical protein